MKNKILNLFSFKLNTNEYERSLLIRKFYYKVTPYVLGFFFITIFFWPSIYNIYENEKKPVLEKKTKKKLYLPRNR